MPTVTKDRKDHKNHCRQAQGLLVKKKKKPKIPHYGSQTRLPKDR